MKRPRVIPVLLLHEGGLVKSVKFRQYKYVGDPINAVKIFNEKEVDEICILDISKSKQGKSPDIAHISAIVSEAFMPVAYGGGISTIAQAEKLFYNGVEKVVLNYAAVQHPELITELAKRFGSQSIVVSIDIKTGLLGRMAAYTLNATKKIKQSPVNFAKEMESRGAGEILFNCIDRDGTYTGYSIDAIQKFYNAVNIPIIACGGASGVADFQKAIAVGASAVAAGSMFVFQRPHNAVLISYPTYQQLVETIK